MKKILSLAMVFCLCLCMGVTAFATDITVDGVQSGTTNVAYGLESSYTVVIPDTIIIDSDTHKGAGAVSASDVIIAANTSLRVTLAGKDALVDEADADNKLTYKIGKTDGGSDVDNDTVVLTVASGAAWDTEVVQNLFFELTQDVTKAGNYSDTLTFTVTVG